jgi:hypothetical protein
MSAHIHSVAYPALNLLLPVSRGGIFSSGGEQLLCSLSLSLSRTDRHKHDGHAVFDTADVCVERDSSG